MSSAGFSPLAVIAPDLYAKQTAIQRRQAFAQALLQDSQSNPGSGAYGGLRNAGNAVLGALLAKGGDEDMAALYGSPSDAQDNTAPPPSKGVAMGRALSGTILGQDTLNAAPNGIPTLTPRGTPLSEQPNPDIQISNTPGGGPSMPTEQPQQATAPQPQRPRTISSAMGSFVTTLPGLTPQQSMVEFFQNNSGYWKALNDSNALTDAQKQIVAAYPNNPQAQAQALQGIVTKAGSIPVTRGMVMLPDGTRAYAPPPAPAGYQYVQGRDGNPQLVPVQGGQQAVAGSGFAAQAPKALLTPATGYGSDNLPIASNQADMSGNGAAARSLIPGIDPGAVQSVESRGNPNAVSPAGAVGPMQTMPGTLASPGYGVQPAQNNSPQEQTRVGDDYLNAMQGLYKNPVLAHIAYNWGPQNTNKWLAAGGDFAKLPLETQRYLGQIAVAQGMAQRGAGQQPGNQPPAGQSLRPELPAGQTTYMQGQAKDAAGRHDGTVAAAAESPMRINVLDNIIGLSQSGVATGPGQDFQNKLGGFIVNSPLLSMLPGMANARDNLGRFQELQKFTYQNAIRSWQAAGGTGTDAQMESMAHANPNDNLFPQALQAIAKWGKAAELAVQGKANAQDQFLAKNGQTPQNQVKFENTWRNSFDPKVFQYSLMSPQEKQIAAAKISPAEAKAFLAKQMQLRAMGALQ